MGTPSLFEQTGLSWKFSKRLTGMKTIDGAIRPVPTVDYTEFVIGYSHTKEVGYGCKTAQITLQIPAVMIDDLYEDGLMRHIEVLSESGDRVWSGFVENVTVNVAGVSATRGPASGIANRVYAIYTPVYYDVSPPAYGAQTITTISENTVSQERFGIFEKVINAGTCPTIDAQLARDRYLTDYGWPEVGGPISVSPDSNRPVTVILDCLGYVHALDMYIYTNLSTSAITVRQKIVNILTAESNDYIEDYRDRVENNPYLVFSEEMGNRYAGDIIRALVSLGDASYNRWIFMVDAHRYPVYKMAPTEVRYEISLTDRTHDVKVFGTNERVLPWQVECGEWLRVSDLLTKSTGYDTLREDPRNRFLESVQYTAPYSLSLTGGRIDTVGQMLAQLTSSGGG